MKSNRPFIIPLCCSVAIAAILSWAFPVVQTFDSASYVEAWTAFGQGRLDMLRTPVYPLILHWMQVLFGSRFLYATVCLQYLTFFISIWFFHRLTVYFCSPTASFWITLIYAANPIMCAWSNHILTESFAISGFVVLLYLGYWLWQEPSIWISILFTVQILFLLFLRPVFVYLLPVFAALSLLLFLQHKKYEALLFLTGVLISCLSLVGYMSAFKKEHGVFAPSSVSIINQYSNARIFGYLNPVDSPDSLLKKDLLAYFESHGNRVDEASTASLEAFDLCEEFDLAIIKSTVLTGKKNNPVKVVKGLLVRTYTSCMESVFSSWIPFLRRLSKAFSPPLGLLYLFLFIYIIVFVIRVYQSRTIPLYSTLLLMLGISNIIVSVIGAQSDWGRLIAPSTPIWLLLVGSIGRIFSKKGSLTLV